MLQKKDEEDENADAEDCEKDVIWVDKSQAQNGVEKGSKDTIKRGEKYFKKKNYAGVNINSSSNDEAFDSVHHSIN